MEVSVRYSIHLSLAAVATALAAAPPTFAEPPEPSEFDESRWTVSGAEGARKPYSGTVEFSQPRADWSLSDGEYHGIYARDVTFGAVAAAFGLGRTNPARVAVFRIQGSGVRGAWAEHENPDFPLLGPGQAFFYGTLLGTVTAPDDHGSQKLDGRVLEGEEGADRGVACTLTLRTTARPQPGWDVLEVTWKTPNGTLSGVGLRHGAVVAVAVAAGRLGVALFEADGTRLKGNYALSGKSTLTPQVLSDRKPYP
jgi:hypothetical protein